MDGYRKWHLACAQLDAYKKHLPDPPLEKHVAEFHSIVKLLEEFSGEDLQSFRIPDDEVKPELIAAISGGKSIYGEKRCDRDLMLRKIEALRSYFTRLQPAPDKPKFGF